MPSPLVSQINNIPESLEDETYFWRLQSLVYNNANILLRKIFVALWKLWIDKKGDIGYGEWDNTSTSADLFIGGIGKQLFEESTIRAKNSLKSGDVEKWDLNLLVAAIKCFSDYAGKLESKFKILVHVRNFVAHSPTMKCTRAHFQTQWKKAERALRALNPLAALGMTPNEINNAKTKTLPWTGTTTIEQQNDDNDYRILQEYENFITLGNILLINGKHGDAFDWYTKAMKLLGLPTYKLETLCSNVSAYLQKGRHCRAKERAQIPTTLKSDWFRGYHRLGKLFGVLNKYDKGPHHHKWTNKSTRELKRLRKLKASFTNRQRQQLLQHLNAHLTTSLQRTCWSPTSEGVRDISGEGEVDANEICAKVNKDFGIHTRGYEPGMSLESSCEDVEKQGSAELMYKLALLLSEGYEVNRDPERVHRLLLLAAKQPCTDDVGVRNVGVSEARHALGLYHDNDVIGTKHRVQAKKWYESALESGENGYSANNLACIFHRGDLGTPNAKKAVLYWQLGTYRQNVRSMENLILHYEERSVKKFLKQIQLLWMYAVHNGSILMKARQNHFNITDQMIKDFNPYAYKVQLKAKLERSSLQHLVADIPFDHG